MHITEDALEQGEVIVNAKVAPLPIDIENERNKKKLPARFSKERKHDLTVKKIDLLETKIRGNDV